MRSRFTIHHLDSLIPSIVQLNSFPNWAIHGAIAKWSDDRELVKVKSVAGVPGEGL
jgi:hypothetical protein